MMFGTAFYIINLNRTEENTLVDHLTPVWPLNVFQNQYELSLGNTKLGVFVDGPNSDMCYVLFFSATFLIQVVFLNMLIAIMGDSFSQAIEQRELNANKEKISIMGDYINLID